MAVLGNMGTNLVDLNRHRGGSEGDGIIINMLEQTHSLVKDMVWKTCNQGKTHTTSIVTKLPEAHMRRLYKGFKQSKSGRAQVSEDTGMMGTACFIDYKEFELEGKDANWLAMSSEEGSEALGNRLANELFNGDRDKDPESINGLMKRLGKANGKDKLKPSYRVISALDKKPDTDDLTSMVFVGHGDRGFFGLVPSNGSHVVKTTTIGLDGKHLVKDDDGNPYPAIEQLLEMDFGCCVKDFRFIAAIRNIPLSQLDPANPEHIDMWVLMTKLYHKINKYKGQAKWVCYVNSDLFTWLDLQAQKKVSPTLTYATIDGEEVLSFRGIPIREDEAIAVGEKWVPLEA